MPREMKRVDRQVTDQSEIDDIINRCTICRIGIIDGDEPYIVPMNFGYRDKTIYIHGAKRGRKVDLLSQSPPICIEFDRTLDMITDENTACRWSQKYESVIAWGKAEPLKTPEERREGLNIIMGHYSERKEWDYPDVIIERTQVIKVPLDRITAKRFEG